MKQAVNGTGTVWEQDRVTPDQCRQARRLLGWTEIQLARQAGLKAETVRYVEAGNGRPKVQTLSAIKAALKAAGIDFTVENGGGAEVQLRKPPG